MSHRDRDKRHARRTTPRQPRHRILVVCEGEITEQEYIKAFQELCRNPRVDVRLADERGVPLTVVRAAVRLKAEAERRADAERDDNLLYDEVWAVYDVDKHPNLNDATQLADAKGVCRAVSNPCFELWALLHFREPPGERSHDAVQAMLAIYLPGSGKHLDMARVLPGYPNALERARRLDADAIAMAEEGRNPSTGVYRLTEAIRVGEPG